MANCKICSSASVHRKFALHQDGQDFHLLECRDCGFHFIDFLDDLSAPPEPVTEEEVAQAEAFDATGIESNKERLQSNARTLRRAVPGGSILDVGCGGGVFLLEIKDHYDRVVGVEVEPKRAAIARKRGLEVISKPLEDPVWDEFRGAFDAITLWDVIEHVNDPLGMAQRMASLLKPGGKILMDTPSRDGFLYRFGNLTASLTAGRHPTTMGIQYSARPFSHKQIFRKRDMVKMLEASGFGAIDIEEKFELSFPPRYYTERLVKAPALKGLAAAVAGVAFKAVPIKNKMIVVGAKV